MDLSFEQISQVMYMELDRRNKKKLKEERDFVEKHGEKALAEIAKLR